MYQSIFQRVWSVSYTHLDVYKRQGIGGKTYKLPEVFVVIATQNPIESEGTYVLSEAQLDRFLLKETVTLSLIHI